MLFLPEPTCCRLMFHRLAMLWLSLRSLPGSRAICKIEKVDVALLHANVVRPPLHLAISKRLAIAFEWCSLVPDSIPQPVAFNIELTHHCPALLIRFVGTAWHPP